MCDEPMRGLTKRLGAWLLTLVLLSGVVPDWGLLTRSVAAEGDELTPRKIPFSINTMGKYVPVSIGTGAYESYIMNGAISEELGTDGKVKFLDGKYQYGMPTREEDYNM